MIVWPNSARHCLSKTIEQMVEGTAKRKPQDASGVTYRTALEKRNGKNQLARITFLILLILIRGLSPSPAAYTSLEGQVLKIFSAEANQNKISEAPGTIGAASAAGLPVAASDGYLILKDVQLAGKKRMLISDFLRGHRLNPKTILC